MLYVNRNYKLYTGLIKKKAEKLNFLFLKSSINVKNLSIIVPFYVKKFFIKFYN